MKSKITLLAMCITICFALITKKSTAQFNGCSNAAFEDTTFTGWTGATGNCSNYPTPTVWTNGIVSHGINALANDILSQQTLLTDPNGYDPNAGLTGGVPNITYLAPGGGNVSVRLGNSAVGAGTEKLDYRIAVTPQNVRFSIM